MAKKKWPDNMTWTPTSEDRKLMAELRERLGVNAESELLRMGLRALEREQQART